MRVSLLEVSSRGGGRLGVETIFCDCTRRFVIVDPLLFQLRSIPFILVSGKIFENGAQTTGGVEASEAVISATRVKIRKLPNSLAKSIERLNDQGDNQHRSSKEMKKLKRDEEVAIELVD